MAVRTLRRTAWLACALVSAGRLEAASAGDLTAAAGAFLATLDAGQRAQAQRPFAGDERLDWGYTPRRRAGLPLGAMSAATRRAAEALLRAGLSAKGVAKAEGIVALESVLGGIEGSSFRDPGRYVVAIFGEPAAHGAWAWRYEGHHLSLNWTLVDGQIAGAAPQFFGANPAEVPLGARRGERVLAAEEDLARALVTSLPPALRARAVLAATAPRDIVTGAARSATRLEDRGVSYYELAERERGLLWSLLEEYAAAQSPAVARQRLTRIRGELENVKFAWMGGLAKGEGHYYRIQGASFLIEYDNTQNGADHIHCVWRDFRGDWGADLLARHYRDAPHHAAHRRGAVNLAGAGPGPAASGPLP